MGVTLSDILANVIAGIIVALLGTITGLVSGWLFRVVSNYVIPTRRHSNILLRFIFNSVAALIIILSPSKLDNVQGINKAIAGIPAIITANAVVVNKASKRENFSSVAGNSYSEENSSNKKVATALKRLYEDLRQEESTYNEFLEELEFDEEFKIGNPYQRLENQEARINEVKRKISELEEYL
jgi:branched-subunit amino acid transport protein AzlD